MVNENLALKAGGLLRAPEPMRMETAPGRVIIKEASVSEAVPMSVLQPKLAAIFCAGDLRPRARNRRISLLGRTMRLVRSIRHGSKTN